MQLLVIWAVALGLLLDTQRVVLAMGQQLAQAPVTSQGQPTGPATVTLTETGTQFATGTLTNTVISGAGTSGGLQLATVPDELAWSTETIEASPAGETAGWWHASLDVVDEHTAFLAYFDAQRGDLKVATFDGTGWTTRVVDGQVQPLRAGEHASLDAVDVSTAFVSYFDASDAGLKVAASTDGGLTWTTATVDAQGAVGEYSSLKAVDAQTVFVSYYDRTNGALKVASSTDGGSHWQVQTVDDPLDDVGLYTSLEAVDANTVFISYYARNTNGRLRFAASRQGGRSGTWTVDPIAYGVGGQHTSLEAVDQGQTLFISFLDEVSGNLKVARSTQGGDRFTWTTRVVSNSGWSGEYNSLQALDGQRLFLSYYDRSTQELLLATSTDGGNHWVTHPLQDFGVGFYGTSGTGEPRGPYSTLRVLNSTTRFLGYYDYKALALKVSRSSAAYVGTGTLESRIIDTAGQAGVVGSFGSLTWRADVEAPTSLAVRVRSSNAADMSGATAWDYCNALAAGDALAAGGCVTDGHQYLQYQVGLTTDDARVTPTLSELTLSYAINHPPTIDGFSLVTSASDPEVRQDPDRHVYVPEGKHVTLHVNADDPDGDNLTYSASNLPPNATFNSSSHRLDWIPTFNQAEADPHPTIPITVSDGQATMLGSPRITVTNVNRPPQISGVTAQMVDEGQRLQVAVAAMVQAQDPDGDPLAYDVASRLPAGAQVGGDPYTFTWTPDFTQAGSYAVTFVVTDGRDGHVEAVVPITVTDVNRLPTLTLSPPGPYTLPEGGSLTVAVTAQDPDGTVPALQAGGLPTHATFTDHANGSGSFQFDPDFTQAGSYTVTIDADSGAATVALAIAVTHVNRPPVWPALENQTVRAGEPLELDITATDPDGARLTLEARFLRPTEAAIETVGAQLLQEGPTTWRFRWTPATTQAGDYRVTLTLRDGPHTATQVLAVTVRHVPPSPPPAPTLELSVPNGGEAWYPGQPQRITWTSTGAIATPLTLAYSTDGGRTYPNLIAANEPNDGASDWTVPFVISDTVRVRISAGLERSTVIPAQDAVASGVVDHLGLAGSGSSRVMALAPAVDAGVWRQQRRSSGVPPALYHHTTVFDPTAQQLYVFGGQPSFHDLWAYDVRRDAWRRLAPIGAAQGRYYHTAVFDSTSRQMYVFGGIGHTQSFNDLWVYRADQDRWSHLHPEGGLPPARDGGGHGAAFDPAAQRLYVFGGVPHRGEFVDLWVYEVRANIWTELTPAGERPAARAYHEAVFDEAAQRLYVFGGRFDPGQGVTRYFDDLWAYDVRANTWERLDPQGGPPLGREAYTAVFDQSTQQMVIFGGFNLSRGALNDLWVYDVATNTWTQAITNTPPSGRYGHAAALDPTTHQMYVFGGYLNPVQGYLDDLWVYQASADRYVRRGTVTSQALDTASIGPIARLAWRATLPTGTAVMGYARSAPDGRMVGALPWERCLTRASGQAIADGGCLRAGDPYLQYRLELTTTEPQATPTVSEVSLSYDDPTGISDASDYDVAIRPPQVTFFGQPAGQATAGVPFNPQPIVQLIVPGGLAGNHPSGLTVSLSAQRVTLTRGGVTPDQTVPLGGTVTSAFVRGEARFTDLSYTTTNRQGEDIRLLAAVTLGATPVVIGSTPIHVAPANRQPRFTQIDGRPIDPGQHQVFTLTEGQRFAITIHAEDPDDPTGASLRYSVPLTGREEPSFEEPAIDPVTGRFTWRPSFRHGRVEPGYFRVVVSDGALTSMLMLELTVQDVVPQFTVAPTRVTPGQVFEVVVSLLAPGGRLLTGHPEGMTISLAAVSSGTLHGTLTQPLVNGVASFSGLTYQTTQPGPITLRATASVPDLEVQSAPIPINRPPLIRGVELTPDADPEAQKDPQGNFVVPEGKRLVLHVEADDPDRDDLAYSATNLPPGASFDAATGHLTWAPGFDQAGSYTLTASVSDGTLGASQPLTITVTDVNQRPGFTQLILRETGAIIEGTLTSPEVQPITLDVTATDPDGDPLVLNASLTRGDGTAVVLSSEEGVAAFVDHGDGTGTFAWPASFTRAGRYSLTFTVRDVRPSPAEALSATQGLALTITDSNRDPVFLPVAPGALDATEGRPWTLQIEADDPDGDRLAYEASDLTALPGAQFDPLGHTLTWTPGFDQAGPHDVTVTVTDRRIVQPIPQRFTVTVANTNQPPTLTLDPSRPEPLPEGEALVVKLLGHDLDDDALSYRVRHLDPQTRGELPALSWVSLDLTHGATLLLQPGYDVLPTGQQDFLIEVTVDDGQGGVATQDLALTVLHVNQPPSLARLVLAEPVPEGTTRTLDLASFATDPDGEALTYRYELLDQPTDRGPVTVPWITLGQTTGLLTVAPDFTVVAAAARERRVPIRVTVEDGHGATAVQPLTITVTDVDQAPTLTLSSPGPYTVAEGGSLTVTVAAQDPDGTRPTLQASGLPTHATFTDHQDGTGTFQFDPDFTQAGSYTVTLDADGGAAIATLPITVSDVNRAPVFTAIGGRPIVVPGQTLAFTVAEGERLELEVRASDPEGDVLTYTLLGLLEGVHFANQILTWTPSFTQAGNYALELQVSDGTHTASQTLAITVTDVTLVFTTEPSTSVTAGAVFPRQPVVQLLRADGSVVTNHAPLSVFLAADGAGTLRGTVAQSLLSGVATFTDLAYATAQAETIRLAATTGPLPMPAAVTSAPIQVVLPNRPPRIVRFDVDPRSDSAVQQAPDGTVQVPEGKYLILHVVADDPDGDDLTYDAPTPPPGASFNRSSHRFDWTPTFTQAGPYTVTFTVSDGKIPQPVARSITITVTDVDRPPTLTLSPPGPYTLPEGGSLTVTVTAQDPDGTIPTLEASGLPAHATFAAHQGGAGTFQFDPDFTQAGAYTVTIEVPATPVRATLPITVSDVNRAPSLPALESQTIDERALFTFTLPVASDPDGDSPTYELTTGPAGARFDPQTRMLTWTPQANQVGSHDLVFTIYDRPTKQTPGVELTTATLHLAVRHVNRAPQITEVTGNQTAQEDQTVNLTISVEDLDGDVVTLTGSLEQVSQPMMGGMRVDPRRFSQMVGRVPGLNVSDVRAVTVAGRYAYVGLATNAGIEFRIVDLSTQQEQGGLELGHDVLAVAVMGPYAYLGLAANNEDEFLVVDVLDRAGPSVVGSLELGTSVLAVAVSGSSASVGLAANAGTEFRIIDLATLTHPREIRGEELGLDVVSVDVTGVVAHLELADGTYHMVDLTGTTGSDGGISLGAFGASLTENPDGAWTLTWPTRSGQAGAYTLTVTPSDGEDMGMPRMIALEIIPRPNRAPDALRVLHGETALSDGEQIQVTANTLLQLRVEAHDPDASDALTLAAEVTVGNSTTPARDVGPITFTSHGDGGTGTSFTGTFEWTPNRPGDYSVIVTASDGQLPLSTRIRVLVRNATR